MDNDKMSNLLTVRGRKFDLQIARWLGWRGLEEQRHLVKNWAGINFETDWFGWWPGSLPYEPRIPIPRYSTDLNAILMVIYEQKVGTLEIVLTDNRWRVRLGQIEIDEVEHPDLPLALCVVLQLAKGWKLDGKEAKDGGASN